MTAASEERVLPHSLEAEQALLAALLLNNQSYEKVSEFLKPVHFSHPLNQKIYEAICYFINKGYVADPITLKDYFEKDGEFFAAGGSAYLLQVASSVVSLINVEDYGRKIFDLYLRRQLIDVGTTLVNDAHTHNLGTDAQDYIEQTEQKLFNLALTGSSGKDFSSFSQSLTLSISMARTAYGKSGHVVGVSTGLMELDKQLGGLHPSDLIILAGRPSMGKTALATNLAFNAAVSNLREDKKDAVVFFSLEMSSEQLATRLLGQESGVPSDKIRRGAIAEEDFRRFTAVAQEFEKLPLFIDDTPALNVSALRTRARRLMRQQGISLIVIDYLQLLEGSGQKGRGSENRVQELSDITRGLKALAKELNVPVIALSQLSRAVEQRDDKRPQLSDLRESGSIEQDADVVMFVYREEYYISRKKPSDSGEKLSQWSLEMEQVRNVAEVIVAKQRHGPIGIVQVHYEPNLTKFSNLADIRHFPKIPLG